MFGYIPCIFSHALICPHPFEIYFIFQKESGLRKVSINFFVITTQQFYLQSFYEWFQKIAFLVDIQFFKEKGENALILKDDGEKRRHFVG